LNNLRILQKISGGLGVFAVAVTLVLFGTGSRLTSFTVGVLTVSAWITIVIPVCFAVIVLLAVILMARQKGIRECSRSLLSAGTGLWFMLLFVSYSVVALAFQWREEGAQNLLAFGLFALGIYAWAMTFPETRVSIMWNVVVYVALGHSVFFVLNKLVGWIPIDERSFAMTAVVGLAAATTAPAKNLFLRLAPYVIFFSIVFSASRTTTFAALVMIGLVAFRSPSQGPRRVARVIVAYVFGLVTILLVYWQYPPAQNRLIAGDEAIKVPSSFLFSSGVTEQPTVAFAINSNGRFAAWTEFLEMLRTPADWMFGLGPGAAAEYGGEHLTYFPQVLNEYLRILIDNGILGLGLFLIAMVGLFVTLICSKRIPRQYQFGALLTLFALSVVSITDGAFIYPFSTLPSALLVGLALGFLFRARGITAQSTATEPVVSVVNH
jgi:hypothetical protein